ncbi:hypothetical protein [Corynebacterium glyciniphilum]|uniref:hypothetical protein n=1 Tax=Corynebacterium glyciniphilum TaxID=1404244 RepID=UPI0011AB7138|nr:hypothetical protein [Corynebacterium glyciniphilum]
MAVRVNIPHLPGDTDHRIHRDAVSYSEDDGLLRVRGEGRKQLALYNRGRWDSAVIIEDENRTEYGDVTDHG